MTLTRTYSTALFLSLLATAPLHAQEEVQFGIRVAESGDRLRAQRIDGQAFGGPLRVSPGLPVVVTVECVGNVDCAAVQGTLTVGGSATDLEPETGATGSRAVLRIPGVTSENTQQGRITLVVDGDTVAPVLRIAFEGEEEPRPARTPEEVARTSCSDRLTLVGTAYDRRADLAQFVVTPQGTVLARPEETVDEDDNVIVYVLGPESQLQNLQISRSSPIRAVANINILGQEPAREVIDEQSEEACSVVRAVLGDFGSPRGEVKIARVADGGAKTDLATFDFAVNPLFTGAFSFGPVVTFRRDRVFGTLPNREITVTEQSEQQTDYVVAYTHFLTGRRDTEKSSVLHLDPILGLKPDELLEHVFAGVSLDFMHGTFFVSVGVHGSDITEIDPASDLVVGDQLPAEYTSVPTRERWEWAPFAGLTIDVRAAAQFIRKAGESLFRS